jgi:hypothetical protein
VLEDFGPRQGRAWCDADEEATGRATLIRDLLAGRYISPIRIIAFNTAEGWSRDVALGIADELRRRYVEHDDLPGSVLEFVDAHRHRLDTERREDFTLRV